jgi:tetratricopeptide (TPR) repeat protein
MNGIFELMIRIGFLLLLLVLPARADDDGQARDKADAAFAKGDFMSAVGYYTLTIGLSPHDSQAFFSRGSCYANLGHFDLAVADFSTSLQLRPGQWDVYYTRGRAYEADGKYGEAIADFHAAIACKPESSFALVDIKNELAWLLATCPDDKFRDGKQAVGIGLDAFKTSEGKSTAVMDTLAAAYAEAGDAVDAAKWEERFLQTPKLDPKVAADAAKRLDLYKEGEPFHQPDKD